MRSLSATAILLLSLLFLAAKFGDARKDLAAADYWKSMMKGKPMPTVIEEVLVNDQDGETSISKQEEKKMLDPSEINMAHFKRDFETTRNDLIYHGQNNMGHTTSVHDDDGETSVHDHDGETSVSKQMEKKMLDPSQINMAHFKRDFETTRNDLIYHGQNNMGHTTSVHDDDGETSFHDHDGETSVSKQKEKKMLDPSQINMAHFKRDFETTRNDLIYHGQNNMGHTTPGHDHDGETSVSKQKEKKMLDPSQINMAHFKRDFETTRNDLIYHGQNNMGHTTPTHDHDGETFVSKQKEKKMLDPSQINMGHFKRDFETTHNDLIYHSQNNMGHISPN